MPEHRVRYPDISAATLHPCVLARFWLSVGGIPPVFARPGVPGNTPQNKPDDAQRKRVKPFFRCAARSADWAENRLGLYGGHQPHATRHRPDEVAAKGIKNP